jgi:acetyl esterase
MPKDEAVRALLRSVDANASPPREAFEDPVAALSYIQQARDREVVSPPTIEVGIVEDREILDGLTVRIYRDGDGPLPVLVYFHGGGWATGTLDSQDDLCRRLAVHGRVVVISVDYRLTPEHPFPAPFDDAYGATEWAHRNAEDLGGDATRLIVMGGSSGANLAAAVALHSRDGDGPPIALQVLMYPPLDSAMDSLSADVNGDGYILTTDRMRLFWQLYAPQLNQRRNPLVSPLHSPAFEDLPPTFIEAAEFDPLRDDAVKYANRLREAGGEVELTIHADLLHGFIGHAGRVPRADAAVSSVVDRIRDRMSASPRSSSREAPSIAG